MALKWAVLPWLFIVLHWEFIASHLKAFNEADHKMLASIETYQDC